MTVPFASDNGIEFGAVGTDILGAALADGPVVRITQEEHDPTGAVKNCSRPAPRSIVDTFELCVIGLAVLVSPAA